MKAKWTGTFRPTWMQPICAGLVLLNVLGCSRSPDARPAEGSPAPTSSTSIPVVISREHFTNPPSFTYELRVADSTIPDETETEWFSGDDLLGSEPIFLADARPEGDARVFSFGPFLLLSSATNQTIVAISPGHPAEVFCFSLPSPPRLGHWSQWQKPTFTEAALTPGSIVEGAATQVRRTNALTARFEFRFQFTEAATSD